MSQDALTHIIVTGQDPRGLPEFSACGKRSTNRLTRRSRS